MSGTHDFGDTETGIRVVVTPSQSSYFAGESFSVSITITNTHSSQWVPSALRSKSHSHKRAAHSISSAPLARPPTSPGTPRTAVAPLPSFKTSEAEKISRKGLIGRGFGQDEADKIPEFLDQSRKRLLAKSHSVSLSSQELEERLSHSEGQAPASDGMSDRVSSPRTPSALSRTPTLSVATTHPHARKLSALDGQLQLQDMHQSPISSSPATPNASSSTFSLSLDTIVESTTQSPLPPQTPAVPSPDPGMTAIVDNIRNSERTHKGDHPASRPPRLPLPHSSTYSHPNQERRGSLSRLGNGVPGLAVPRTAFSATFPPNSTELILYSYAQLTGVLSITALPGSSPATPDSARALNALRSTLLKRQAMGGGSMDITSSLDPQQYRQHARKRSHVRSSSFSSGLGLLSFLSPSLSSASPNPGSSTQQTQEWSPFHGRTQTPPSKSSTSLSGLSTSGSGIGLGLGSVGDEEVDPETPLPVFEVQPAMLAVDLNLAPGESRTYTYAIKLPENLPPTFKGRTFKFSYEFSVGICRAGSSHQPPASPSGRMGPTGANSNSRVMKVPIRMYNHVSVGRAPRPYDLLWPVARSKHPAPLPVAKVLEDNLAGGTSGPSSVTLSPSSTSANAKSFDDLRAYAQRLVASVAHPEAQHIVHGLPPGVLSPYHEEPERDREQEGTLTGCREAVEILTRNHNKVSYDVNKEGVKVAVLTFTKSAYRLGETVLGVVELNEPGSCSRVLKLSAFLEAHESLPSSIALTTTSRQLRRVHAEHHSSFLPSMLRTTFALDIPSDASPAFQVDIDGGSQSGRKPSGGGGLEWKVRLCLLVSVASSATKGVGPTRLKHLVRDGPRGEWGTAWKASANIAPMERPESLHTPDQTPMTPGGTVLSWAGYFASFVGAAGTGYHDGDDDDAVSVDEVNLGDSGEESKWQELNVETVECEVPIKVWPGNTAFKAMEVVFDV